MKPFTEVVGVRINAVLLEKLDRLCEISNRTRSGLLRDLLVRAEYVGPDLRVEDTLAPVALEAHNA